MSDVWWQQVTHKSVQLGHRLFGSDQIPLAKNSILKTTSTSNTNYSSQVVTFTPEPLTINSRPRWCDAWAVPFVWKVMMLRKTPINAYGFIIKDTTQEQATCRDAYDRKGWVSVLSLGETMFQLWSGFKNLKTHQISIAHNFIALSYCLSVLFYL